MTVTEMVVYLRTYVIDALAQTDPTFEGLTDEQIILALNAALSQEYFFNDPFALTPTITLEEVPQDKTNLLLLFAKKEIYFHLATRVSPLEDIGADDNNYLKRDQRFWHYMELVTATQDDISALLNGGVSGGSGGSNSGGVDGGGGTGGYVMTYDVTLVNRFFTRYNFEHTRAPNVRATAMGESQSTIELAWITSYMSTFLEYEVWISKEPFFDEYQNPQLDKSKATKVYRTGNPHNVKCRIEGLESNTLYYIVVSASPQTKRVGYSSLAVQTLSAI